MPKPIKTKKKKKTKTVGAHSYGQKKAGAHSLTSGNPLEYLSFSEQLFPR